MTVFSKSGIIRAAESKLKDPIFAPFIYSFLLCNYEAVLIFFDFDIASTGKRQLIIDSIARKSYIHLDGVVTPIVMWAFFIFVWPSLTNIFQGIKILFYNNTSEIRDYLFDKKSMIRKSIEKDKNEIMNLKKQIYTDEVLIKDIESLVKELEFSFIDSLDEKEISHEQARILVFVLGYTASLDKIKDRKLLKTDYEFYQDLRARLKVFVKRIDLTKVESKTRNYISRPIAYFTHE
jgi:hypothetical protein